ncbi:hypothetical protein HDV01_001791 [Terramyces sp. JEL0728]|nr:hypothetical protein HDV01_001791 [Terramyces sp. JEL0728]
MIRLFIFLVISNLPGLCLIIKDSSKYQDVLISNCFPLFLLALVVLWFAMSWLLNFEGCNDESYCCGALLLLLPAITDEAYQQQIQKLSKDVAEKRNINIGMKSLIVQKDALLEKRKMVVEEHSKKSEDLKNLIELKDALLEKRVSLDAV